MSCASSASFPSAAIFFRILLAARAADMQSLHCTDTRHTDADADKERNSFFSPNFVWKSSECFHHLLPGDFSQLPVILDDSPQEKVPAWVSLCLTALVPELNMRARLIFRLLEEKRREVLD